MRTHTKTFHIRFTEKEYERLCNHAKKSGLPKTTYIRHMINGYAPKEQPPAPFYDFYRQAYACGTNLNQLCRMAHQFGSLHTKKLVEVMNQLYAMMNNIQENLLYVDDLDVPDTLEQGRLQTEKDKEDFEQ